MAEVDWAAFIGPRDRDLLNRSLTTSDPEGVATRARIPKMNPGPPIVFQYDVTPHDHKLTTRPYVWCGHCGSRTHWKGYVVDLGDNTLVTLGGVCGPKHFGFEYGAVENRFNAEVARQHIVPRVARLRAALPALQDAVRYLLTCPATREIDAAFEGLHTNHGRLWRSLHTSVAMGRPELITRRRVLDTEGMARTRENLRRRYEAEIAEAPTKTARTKLKQELRLALSEVKDREREEVIPHGILLGRGFVTRQEPLGRRLALISRDLHALADRLKVATSDDLATADMETALLDGRKLLSRADEASDAFSEAEEFWSRRNLAAVTDWANHNDLTGGHVSLVAGETSLQTARTSVGLAPDLVMPDEDFSEFRRLALWPARPFDDMPMSRRLRVAA